MSAALPHLSVEGFITNKNILMVKLFEHFIASEYSQSNIYIHKVASLKYLLYHYKETDELYRELTNTLTVMYKCYFETAEVHVDITDDPESSVNEITIDITTTDTNEKIYQLSKSIQEVDGKINNFDELTEEMYEGIL